MSLCLELFLSFLRIGAFSFGGGYAAIPLIQGEVITRHGWLSPSEFTDLMTIAEMTPGPIAINAASFAGNQVAGIPGALFATVGVILPSCLIVTLLSCLYVRFRKLSLMQDLLRSLRPAVVSMILSAGLIVLLPAFFGSVTGLSTLFSETNYRMILWFVLALLLLRKYHKNPILVMLLTGLLELASQVFSKIQIR